ncbi:MAG: FHA domain-containing protein [Fimbriimonas sp.]
MKFFALLVGSVCLVSSACAQSDYTIKLPDGSPRSIWVGQSATEPPPTNFQKSTQPEAILKDPKGTFVLVKDDKTGNLAARKLADIKAGKDTFTEADFAKIASVRVTLEHEGKPVAVASIKFGDQLQLLDQDANGEARFRNVAPGRVKVEVLYRSDGKQATPVVQEFDLALERPQPEPLLRISLPETTETIGATSASAEGEPKTSGPAPSGSAATATDAAKQPSDPGAGFRSFIVYLIFLAGAIAAGYFLLKYIRDNPGVVGPQLEKLGVQIPKPSDAPMADADPVVTPPATPMPVQKIVLDPGAPDPVAAPTFAQAPVASAPSGNPRLIAENGDVLTIGPGTLEVGREVGLGLSLLGESTVSRRHASVVRSGDSVVVQDLGSTNGTFVNGVKVAGQSPLNHGDAVQFGSVRFRYEG